MWMKKFIPVPNLHTVSQYDMEIIPTHINVVLCISSSMTCKPLFILFLQISQLFTEMDRSFETPNH